MSAEEDERLQSSNKRRICDKLFNAVDNKVRDHCNVTGKYRGSVHSSCNINLKLTKEGPIIFHNLRVYESHFIMQEIGKFYVKKNCYTKRIRKIHGFYN